MQAIVLSAGIQFIVSSSVFLTINIKRIMCYLVVIFPPFNLKDRRVFKLLKQQRPFGTNLRHLEYE